MQKEDLIKRLRLIAAITTTVFVFMVVALLVQFGFIAYYHSEIRELHNHNTELQQSIDDLETELEFINGEYVELKKAQEAGTQNA